MVGAARAVKHFGLSMGGILSKNSAGSVVGLYFEGRSRLFCANRENPQLCENVRRGGSFKSLAANFFVLGLYRRAQGIAAKNAARARATASNTAGERARTRLCTSGSWNH